jgi:hypothetical protein
MLCLESWTASNTNLFRDIQMAHNTASATVWPMAGGAPPKLSAIAVAQPRGDEAGRREAHSSSRRDQAINKCSTLSGTPEQNGQCLL